MCHSCMTVEASGSWFQNFFIIKFILPLYLLIKNVLFTSPIPLVKSIYVLINQCERDNSNQNRSCNM